MKENIFIGCNINELADDRNYDFFRRKWEDILGGIRVGCWQYSGQSKSGQLQIVTELGLFCEVHTLFDFIDS